MDFRELGVFVRSASFELINNDIYHAPAPYSVYLDGRETGGERRRNVFSVYGLLPDTEYRLEVRAADGGRAERRFRTREESFRLNVRSFGAAGDGRTPDTNAVQAAILACPENGTVWFPKGVYLTAPLFLKSRTTLELDEGATILGMADRSAYPILPGVTVSANEKDEYYLGIFEGNPLDSYASLLTGIGVRDVDITGLGTVDANAGAGDWWREPKKKHGAWRPRMLFLNRCENVRVQGVTFQNSYAWTLHPWLSAGVGLLDIRIVNDPDSPNTDGIDVESCRGVDIVGARISVGDDCIVLKSGKMYLGEKLHRPTSDVSIRNCLLERGHGAVVIGSEVSAGVGGVFARQCLFSGTDRGLRVKTRRGRGRASVVDGIRCRDIRMENVTAPFVINMFYFCDPDGHSEFVWSKEKLPADEFTPRVGRLSCENIRCVGCGTAGMYFYGLPEMPIDEIVMRHISISFSPDAEPGYPAMMDHIEPVCKLGGFAANVRRLVLDDVAVEGYEREKFVLLNVPDLEQKERGND